MCGTAKCFIGKWNLVIITCSFWVLMDTGACLCGFTVLCQPPYWGTGAYAIDVIICYVWHSQMLYWWVKSGNHSKSSVTVYVNYMQRICCSLYWYLPIARFLAIGYQIKGNLMRSKVATWMGNNYQHTKLHHCSYISMFNLQHILSSFSIKYT